MKNVIEFETSIGLNGGSYRTTIPRKVVEVMEARKNDKILWKIDMKNNSLSIVFKPKNDSVNIDETG